MKTSIIVVALLASGLSPIIPLWLQHETAATRMADVQMPLLYRALQFSYVHAWDTSKMLY